jgi:hypothetical protein
MYILTNDKTLLAQVNGTIFHVITQQNQYLLLFAKCHMYLMLP